MQFNAISDLLLEFPYAKAGKSLSGRRGHEFALFIASLTRKEIVQDHEICISSSAFGGSFKDGLLYVTGLMDARLAGWSSVPSLHTQSLLMLSSCHVQLSSSPETAVRVDIRCPIRAPSRQRVTEAKTNSKRRSHLSRECNL